MYCVNHFELNLEKYMEIDMKSEKLILLILASIQFTNIMDFMIMMPLGPQLMNLFSINPQQFSIIVSAYTFSAGIFGLLSAFFIDKFDRKKSLLFTYIGFTIGTFACALSPTYNFLIFARIFTGAFGGLLGAMVLSIVGDLIPFERRATAMGTVMTAFSMAAVFGVPFGLFMASKMSWHAPFIFIGIAGIILTFLIYLIIPSMKSHIQSKEIKINPFDVITKIADDKNQILALLLISLVIFGHFIIVPFLSPHMVANVGFTEEQLAYIYLFGGGATIFTSPIVGKISDKYGHQKVFTIAALISIIPIFLITNMPQLQIPLVLIITTMFFIFGNARMIPTQTIMISTVSPQSRGGFMSISSSVQQFTTGFASFIAGSIILKTQTGTLNNYNYVGYIAITATLLSVLIARKLKVGVNVISPEKEKAVIEAL